MSDANIQVRTAWRIREIFRHRWLGTRIAKSLTRSCANIRESCLWPTRVTVPSMWSPGTAIMYLTSTISIDSWSSTRYPSITAWVNMSSSCMNIRTNSEIQNKNSFYIRSFYTCKIRFFTCAMRRNKNFPLNNEISSLMDAHSFSSFFRLD